MAGIAFALFALEVTLRVTHAGGARPTWSRPDPVLGWRFVPGARYWYLGENDHPIMGRINQFGWRDHEWPVKETTESARVAVLGDSFVEAFQVEQEATFHSLVEAQLTSDLGRRVELMSFGRSGMTQTEELLTLQRDVLRFQPEVVVLFFYPGNDVADVSRETASNKLRPFLVVARDGKLELDLSFARSREYRLKAALNPLLRRSALAAWLLQQVRFGRFMPGQREVETSPEPGSEQLNGVFTLATQQPDPVYQQNYLLNRRLIGEIAASTQSAGAQLVLVGIDFLYKPEDVTKFRAIDSTFDPDYFDRDLGSLARELGILYVGLQQPFSEHYQRTDEELRWGHWNYAGHRVVADLLGKKLKEVIGGD